MSDELEKVTIDLPLFILLVALALWGLVGLVMTYNTVRSIGEVSALGG